MQIFLFMENSVHVLLLYFVMVLLRHHVKVVVETLVLSYSVGMFYVKLWAMSRVICCRLLSHSSTVIGQCSQCSILISWNDIIFSPKSLMSEECHMPAGCQVPNPFRIINHRLISGTSNSFTEGSIEIPWLAGPRLKLKLNVWWNYAAYWEMGESNKNLIRRSESTGCQTIVGHLIKVNIFSWSTSIKGWDTKARIRKILSYLTKTNQIFLKFLYMMVEVFIPIGCVKMSRC